MNQQQAAMVALETWLSKPAGQYFLQREQAWLNRVLPDLFGFRAIQMGTPMVDGLSESRIPHRIWVADSELEGWPPARKAEVFAHYEELPFDSQSLDLVVMPHVLEFASDPHQVLREVERVLLPEGRVVLTGFNPMSLWGLKHRMMRRWGGVWPAGCDPIHIGRLKDWLKLLSLEPELGRFGAYRVPAESERGLQRFGFLEQAGDRWWPVCGGVYYLCAVKRVRGMRLLGPAFKSKAQTVKQLKPVAQKLTNKTPKIES